MPDNSAAVAAIGMSSSQPRGSETLVRKVLRNLGVDRAVAYTLLGRGWSVLSGPLTLLLIARFLRPDQQGFYYTFNSVIALNIFFELGLTYVLLQFASHEKAHLEWTNAGSLTGSEVAQTRLAALLKLAMKWYGAAGLLVVALVMPAGLLFFIRNSAGAAVAWRSPWIWLAIASAFDLVASPLLAILEGCGKVHQVASMRVGQNVLSSLGLWATLILHGGLFAAPVVQTVNVLYALTWIMLGYRRFFGVLLRTDVTRAPFNWKVEVWPFQWRIALSWLSGYFIFQLFNPVLFATHGPVVAGQMGMSVTLCSALLSVAIAWMSTKSSPFGILVARKQWTELDSLFFRTYRQSAVVLLLGAIVVFGGIVILSQRHHPYATRILGPLPFGCLLLATMMNHAVFCEAQYLRTHKSEPFLWLSIAMALATGSSTLLLARPFSSTGVSVGYMICCSLSLVWGTSIFVQKRREWHV